MKKAKSIAIVLGILFLAAVTGFAIRFSPVVTVWSLPFMHKANDQTYTVCYRGYAVDVRIKQTGFSYDPPDLDGFSEFIYTGRDEKEYAFSYPLGCQMITTETELQKLIEKNSQNKGAVSVLKPFQKVSFFSENILLVCNVGGRPKEYSYFEKALVNKETIEFAFVTECHLAFGQVSEPVDRSYMVVLSVPAKIIEKYGIEMIAHYYQMA